MHTQKHTNLPLKGERYTSRDFFSREWENVWTKTWLIMGRADDIPEAGDFYVEDVGPESILIVRQADAGIRAFYNVCQHRGNRLAVVPDGSLNAFTCSYHGWKWGLDGACLEAQDAEDFTVNPCGSARLEEIRCDVFAGFIWINMDPDCVSLKKFLGPIWDEWAAYPMGKMTRIQAISVRMPCNWKTVQDNFHETYHLATAHPVGLNSVEDDYRQTAITMFDGGHALGITQGSIPARRKFGDNPSLGEQIRMELQAWGLNAEDFRGREYETRNAIQKQKRQLGPERGFSHYNNMSDAQLTDVFHYTVFPNFSTSLNSDGMLYQRALPHPTDPELCVFDCWFYAVGTENAYSRLMTEKGGADKQVGPAPREWRNYGEGSLGVILDDDAVVMANQQRALNSRGYKGSRLANQERRIQQYHDMIDRYMDGYRPR